VLPSSDVKKNLLLTIWSTRALNVSGINVDIFCFNLDLVKIWKVGDKMADAEVAVVGEADEEGVDEESAVADGGFVAAPDEVVVVGRMEVLRVEAAGEQVDGKLGVDVERVGGDGELERSDANVELAVGVVGQIVEAGVDYRR
jgi:hypothetical protein